MIPTTVEKEVLKKDFEIIEEKDQPTLTYRMDLEKERVKGLTDKKEAMKQVVFKILQTERYQYPIYSANYGIEFKGLIGMPISYVVPEIERRIKEALLWDERITKVYNFSFEIKKKAVAVTFYFDTVFNETDKVESLEVYF